MWDQSVFTAAGGRKYVSRQEGLRLLDTAAEDGLANAALVGLLACTGCRLSEALGLTRFQLDGERSSVRLVRLKQRRRRPAYREVPVPAALMAMLLELGRSAGEDGRLWHWSRQTAWRRLKRLMRRAGIEGPQANSRGLRHGFGVACALARVDPRITQRWMGHSKAATTAIYLEVMGDEARSLIAQLWPYQRLDMPPD